MHDVKLITDMPKDELVRLPEHLNRIFELIRKSHSDYICDSLLERLAEKLREAESAPELEGGRHYSMQQPGMTRDCIDPWSYAKVMASSAVVPCCRAAEPVGLLSEGRPLHEIVNDRQMMEFRRTLLTGELRDLCLSCNIRGWTSIEKLRFKVAMFSRFGKFAYVSSARNAAAVCSKIPAAPSVSCLGGLSC